MSDESAAVATISRFDTSILSGFISSYQLESSGSAWFNIIYRMSSLPPRARRIDIYVVPGISHSLRKPIPVVLRKEDELFLAECRDLDIIEGGASEGEALEEFSRFFAIDAQSLLSATDESLNDDALQLRNKYREYLGA